jgi:hypothetical protein
MRAWRDQLAVMTTKPGNAIVTLALLAALWPFSSVAVSSTPKRVTVCDLTHFGADSEGLTFRVQGIYASDFRHGAWLYDLENDACSLEFGVKQSDVDGSVKRFDQAVVDAVMHLGPGTRQFVDAEVVFHWVVAHPNQPGPGVRSPIGVLELRRVLQSTTESRSIGQVSTG